MKTIGITGRSGSGKSSISAYIAQKGSPVCDADWVARQVLMPGSPCLPLLQNAFGADILASDGELNRHLLADRAFKTPEGTQKLTEITHPAIYEWIRSERTKAEQAGEKLFFIDGAVIVGTEIQSYCDAILLVYTPYETAVARICARDGIQPEMARRRLDAQMPLEKLQEAADYQICNDGTVAQAEMKAEQILQTLLA